MRLFLCGLVVLPRMRLYYLHCRNYIKKIRYKICSYFSKEDKMSCFLKNKYKITIKTKASVKIVNILSWLTGRAIISPWRRREL